MSSSCETLTGSPLSLSALASAAVHDRFVWLQAAVFAGVIVFYSLPCVPEATKQTFSWSWLCTPFMVWPVVGAFSGRVPGESPHETRFWTHVGLGFACWLTALVVYGLAPNGKLVPATTVLVDLCYLGFYGLLFAAFDAHPHKDRLGITRRELRLRLIGYVVFALGWAAYFVLFPSVIGESAYWPVTTESALFLLLDASLLIRIATLWQTTESARWRTIYSLFGIATLSVTVTDGLGLLQTLGVELSSGASWPDLIWGVPATVFLVAARTRGYRGLGDATWRHHAPVIMRPPAQVGTYLLLAAVGFPLVHGTAAGLDWLPRENRVLFHLLWATMMVSTAGLTILAIVAHRILDRDRQHQRAERESLEAQLLQAQKMEAIGRLAGGVAHDFNNLLTAISGYTDLVLEGLSADDPNRTMLAEVRSATERAGSLTRQLLAFSRRQTLKTEPVNVATMVRGMRNMIRPVIGEDIALVTHLSDDTGTVLANANQLEQVLLNLVVNARDAMPHGGTLTLSSQLLHLDAEKVRKFPWLKPGPFTTIAVSDTGTGIPPEILPHIFDPFFTTKDREKGTGLGLSMVYGTTRQFGGAVDVTSVPGDGATFTIWLPVSSQAPPEQSGHVTLTPVRGTETILIAEDDEPVRVLARTILSRQGYRVLDAGTSQQAADLAGTHNGPIQLLLTDVVMPGLSGPALATRVRAVRPKIRVLFMSGYTDRSFGPNDRLPANADLLQKPFTAGSLVTAVRETLDRKRASITQTNEQA